jgi:peptide/nickel transport system permease protein
VTRYFVRRLIQAVGIVFLVTAIVFGIARLSGSPADLMLPQGAGPEQRAQLVREYGLDQPLPLQYVYFLANAAQGDFGQSIRFRAPAMELVLDRLPATIELALAALAIAVLLGIPLGTLAALRHRTRTDYIVTSFLTVGQATPSFWLGILLILFVGVELGWLPISGRDGWQSLILPAITLSIVPLVSIARLTRSSLISIIPQDYVRTARAKGLRQRTIIRTYILRNGLIPVVTIAGVSMAELLSGAVITEQIFAWPGIGRLAIESIYARDYPVVQAVAIVTAVIVVAMNLFVDMLYFFLDPRIRDAAGRAN